MPARVLGCRDRAREERVTSVVNLNRFRKGKKREEAQQRAAENRTLFGRSKKDRREDDSERRRAARELDGKKLN